MNLYWTGTLRRGQWNDSWKRSKSSLGRISRDGVPDLRGLLEGLGLGCSCLVSDADCEGGTHSKIEKMSLQRIHTGFESYQAGRPANHHQNCPNLRWHAASLNLGPTSLQKEWIDLSEKLRGQRTRMKLVLRTSWHPKGYLWCAGSSRCCPGWI